MTAYYNEIDPYAAQWLRNLIDAGHIAPGIVDERSIEDVYPSDLRGFTQCHFFAGIGVWSHALRLAGWSDDRPVWTGSCPCQPFSAAGKGAGTSDERHLWPAWHHLIRECRPVVVVGEQVEAAIAHGWLDLVHADLEAEDYAFAAVGLPAASVGAPHIRQRLWFVGHAISHGSRRDAGAVPGAQGEAGRRVRGVADRAELAGAARDMGHAGDARLALGLGLAGVPGGQGGADPGQAAVGAGVHAGKLANPDKLTGGQGCAVDGGRDSGGDAQSRPGSGGGVVSGFWSAADWIACRDGKSRPVEPGTFPLAHGASARVGRLRAYGNAIVAPLAAEFVRAIA